MMKVQFLALFAIVGLVLAVPVPTATVDPECVDEEVEMEPGFNDINPITMAVKDLDEDYPPCEDEEIEVTEVTEEPEDITAFAKAEVEEATPVPSEADCISEEAETAEPTQMVKAATEAPSEQPCIDPTQEDMTEAPTPVVKMATMNAKAASEDDEATVEPDCLSEGDEIEATEDYSNGRSDEIALSDLLENAEAAKLALQNQRIDFDI